MPTIIEIPDEIFELLKTVMQDRIGNWGTQNGWQITDVDYVGGPVVQTSFTTGYMDVTFRGKIERTEKDDTEINSETGLV